MPQNIIAMIQILCGVYSGPQYTTCSKSFHICTRGKLGNVEHVSPEAWDKAMDECVNDSDRQGWKK